MISFTCRRNRSPFTISASATYSDSGDASAVIFLTRDNQLMVPLPVITAPPETDRRVSGQVPPWSDSTRVDSLRPPPAYAQR